jgi:hypothetical protein
MYLLRFLLLVRNGLDAVRARIIDRGGGSQDDFRARFDGQVRHGGGEEIGMYLCGCARVAHL